MTGTDVTLLATIGVVLAGVTIMLALIKGRIDKLHQVRDSGEDEGLPGTDAIRAAFRSFGRD